ncbi:MAG: hypothetical protein ACYDDU_21940 [Dermatophilaceae bacterium]
MFDAGSVARPVVAGTCQALGSTSNKVSILDLGRQTELAQRRLQRLQQDGVALRVVGEEMDVAAATGRGERLYLTGERRVGH